MKIRGCLGSGGQRHEYVKPCQTWIEIGEMMHRYLRYDTHCALGTSIGLVGASHC